MDARYQRRGLLNQFMVTFRNWWPSRRACFDNKIGFVLLVFGLLALQSLVVGVLPVRVRSGSTAAVVFGLTILFAILVVLLVALVLGKRWAWFAFIFLYGFGLILDTLNFTGVFEFAINVVRFAFLVSTPMRRHVGITKSARDLL